MEHIDFRDQIKKNKIKSALLMIFVAIFIVVIGYVISFAFSPRYFFTVMIISIIVALLYTWFNFYNSDRIAILSVKAREAKRQEFPDFHRLIESLRIASNLPKPKLYVMDSDQINAFASGRDPKHAIICVTTGALKKLDRRELEGVLAHELGHISNYDIRYMTLITIMVGMIAIISQIFLRSLWFKNTENDRDGGIFIIIGIILAIFAPIVTQLVQLSISRKREYTADATAVKFTRNPKGLIGALEKIKNDGIKNTKISKVITPLFFSNPLKNLTRTHPPIEKRIEILKKM